MPASTWTHIALESEAHAWAGSGWRAVEAQHKAATMELVHGSLDDQTTLENILEEYKPKLPDETHGLHWLLATPFRYRSMQNGSRFRRHTDPGVFYGAEDIKTACGECGYWRLQMWLDSEGLSKHSTTLQITIFEFHATTNKAIDLSVSPFSSHRPLWMDPKDYTHTQALADKAREAEIGVIRYESVRNPGGHNLALLHPNTFKAADEPYRNNNLTWKLLIEPPHLLVWQRDLSDESYSFHF